MGEDFYAAPSKIAGLSNLMADISNDQYSISHYVKEHCAVSPSGFGGAILDPLREPFGRAAENSWARMGGMAERTLVTSGELNRAAWTYHDQDKRTYEAINRATTDIGGMPVAVVSDREIGGITRPYPNASPIAKSKPLDLKPPNAAAPELADLIAQTSGVVGDVNEAIKSVTRMAGEEINILEKILEPIECNWNELRRIGEAYKAAGNASEASGDNLEAGVKSISLDWDGKAAIAFEDWAGKQVQGMKWEGPVGRVTSDVMNIIADKIRDGVRRVCEKLKEFIESFVDFRSTKSLFKIVVKKIPVIGTAIEAVDLALKIKAVVDLVTTILREIEYLRNQLEEFMAFVQNPAGKGREWVEQKLQPVTSKVEDATKKAALVNDIGQIARVDNTLNKPRDGYEAGAGTQPWEDAV